MRRNVFRNEAGYGLVAIALIYLLGLLALGVLFYLLGV